MKNKMNRVIAVIAAMTMTVGILTGCAGTQGETKETTDSAQTGTEATEEVQAEGTTSDLSGSIQMAGSTSMEKFANALSEVYMQKNPGVTVSAEFIGSSAGIEALLAGSADIGNSSRALKDSEIAGGAVENIVALDGIAVVMDKANTVENLTKADLVSIYTGKINNWSDLGGNNQPIVVVGREAGSGTRGAFEELLEIEDMCQYSNELDSTGAVMAKVAATPGAIGYVSLDVVDDTVKTAKVESVDATAENIKAGTYILSRPFVMATMGEISAQSPEVQELFAYLESAEGKEMIKSVGLITVD